MDINLDEFVNGYLYCALWSSSEENETPLHENYSVADVIDKSRDEARQECARFIYANGTYLRAFARVTGRDSADLGHDLWLSRNHHGAGYWDRYMEAERRDRDYAREVGVILTKEAEALKERTPIPVTGGVEV